jgi:hypothetical protein
MNYKIKWRTDGNAPLTLEAVSSSDSAKQRTRDLLAKYGSDVSIEIWNEDETWQIVSPTGVAEWCRSA